jgi:hypothetical protein
VGSSEGMEQDNEALPIASAGELTTTAGGCLPILQVGGCVVRTAGDDVLPAIDPSPVIDKNTVDQQSLSHVKDTSGETCSKEKGEEQPKQCSSTSSKAAEEDKEFEHMGIPKTSFIEVFKMKIKSDDAIERCMDLVRPHLKSNITSEEIRCITSDIRKMKSNFDTKWKASNRVSENFHRSYSSWIDSPYVIKEEYLPSKAPNPPGKPKKSWDESSSRTKRRATQMLTEQLASEPIPKLLKSVQFTAKKEGEKDLAFILAEAMKSPSRPSKIASKIRDKISFRKYTPEEALALIIDGDLTVDSYNRLRDGAKSHGIDLYPRYAEVLASKAKCRPSELIRISEVSASVSLQGLLEHTAKRIAELQDEVLNSYFDHLSQNQISFKLICSWGFDGSSSQSNYKQKFENPEHDDSSLFATTVIPLQLRTEQNHVLWQNPIPQSVRYCRPLKLAFVKESHQIILSEKRAVDKEIEELIPVEIRTTQSKILSVTFDLSMTVIDGKVLSVVTGTTSQQVCPLCGAKPSQFNRLVNANDQPHVPLDRLKYGLSPLHAWIRCLEFCLNLGYRNVEGLMCWRVDGQIKKGIFEQRKRSIQRIIWEQLALKVDFPKPGGCGSSNDGNTARRAFSEKYQNKFAEILGLELWLVKGLSTILSAINSGLPINADKFGEYCSSLGNQYVQKYNWYHMPVTLHKLLLHGKEVVKGSTLPIGMLSEQAGESRNKLYRQFREFHARKTSRKDNLSDVFNRSMDSSDPIVSNFSLDDRKKKLKKHPLTHEVIALLEEPESFGPRELEEPEDESQYMEDEVQVDEELVLDNDEDEQL